MAALACVLVVAWSTGRARVYPSIPRARSGIQMLRAEGFVVPTQAQVVFQLDDSQIKDPYFVGVLKMPSRFELTGSTAAAIEWGSIGPSTARDILRATKVFVPLDSKFRGATVRLSGSWQKAELVEAVVGDDRYVHFFLQHD